MSLFPSPAEVVDTLLECTVVGSFTTVGYDLRSRISDWSGAVGELRGQTAIVTGGSSGIGRATAHGLLALGSDVVLTSRSAARAKQIASELNAVGTGGTATGMALDTSSFGSIQQFAASLAGSDSIDMIAHNAGALTSTYQTDDRGVELTLSSHLVGPYLLTRLLTPSLTVGARVVSMSSGGMYTQGLDMSRIEMSSHNYNGAVAYARAKRGQVEMVTHLASQVSPEVILHSMHPGWVDTPGVDAGLPGFSKLMGPLLRDADKGADTMIWLAAGGASHEKPGQFWLDRQARRTVYVPGTGTTRAERERLVDWLDEQIAPALD